MMAVYHPLLEATIPDGRVLKKRALIYCELWMDRRWEETPDGRNVIPSLYHRNKYNVITHILKEA